MLIVFGEMLRRNNDCVWLYGVHTMRRTAGRYSGNGNQNQARRSLTPHTMSLFPPLPLFPLMSLLLFAFSRIWINQGGSLTEPLFFIVQDQQPFSAVASGSPWSTRGRNPSLPYKGWTVDILFKSRTYIQSHTLSLFLLELHQEN